MTDCTDIKYQIHNCDIKDSAEVESLIKQDLKALGKQRLDFVIFSPAILGYPTVYGKARGPVACERFGRFYPTVQFGGREQHKISQGRKAFCTRYRRRLSRWGSGTSRIPVDERD